MNGRCEWKGMEGPLWGTLLQASQRVEGRLENSLAGLGLSLAKLGVLDHLVKAGGPIPLGRLAERLSCVKSNMTQLVDRLEADGLVTRVNDPEDRRSVLASITKEGLKRYENGGRALAAEERELLRNFAEGEQEKLAVLLGRFAGE
jgi:DNA-binding MarR family transcriptional regulator